MATWFIVTITILLLTLSISALVKPLLRHWRHRNPLPPGPSLLHSCYLFLTNPLSNFEPVLINLKTTYGPLFTLSTGLGPSIFVADHSLAHKLLVKKGAVFSDRPNFSINFNISTAPYGPTWRLLRRNMAAGIMHMNQDRVNSFSGARRWSIGVLFGRVLEQERDRPREGGVVNLIDHFRHAVFCLMVAMCFGEKFDEGRVNEIGKVQRDMQVIVGSSRFSMLLMFPTLGKILFRSIWKKFEKLRDGKEQVLVPIIKSRIQQVHSESDFVAYIDTLVNLNLPVDEGSNENGRKLSYREMVGLCSEFLTGGADTTASALQWIMANLVKHPQIQRKLYDEIVAVVGLPPRCQGITMLPESVISEEELKKMRYLKAVVLEGLRRHPPAHLVLPHRVVKEVEVEGYVFPEGVIVNFMVGEMGLDPKVWDEPMEFRPERFMVEGDGVFDVRGSKGIKMMPFGAGRRICPGSDLALLHLEYFVANLIWYFDWSAPDGYDVDLTEKTEFGVVMKNPLRARVSVRSEK